MKIKSVVSVGTINDFITATNHPYKYLLNKIKEDFQEMKVGLNIDTKYFYTTKPIEVHNFTDQFIYRFIKDEHGNKIICYEIIERKLGCIYKERNLKGEQLLSEWKSDFEYDYSDDVIKKRVQRNLYGNEG